MSADDRGAGHADSRWWWEDEDEEDEEEQVDVKSNNPHLTGGEKINIALCQKCLLSISLCSKNASFPARRMFHIHLNLPNHTGVLRVKQQKQQHLLC